MKKLYFIIVYILSGNFLSGQNTSVLTHRYDNYRTGWNTSEKILNTGNVNQKQFGLLYTRAVDDQMYATPLLVSSLSINGKTQNVLIVVTMNNSVYAFDADDSATMTPLWHVNITSTGNRVFKSSDLPCSNYGPNIGIIGTPAIDTLSKTMYFVSNEYSNASKKAQQYFHALDITTGNERSGSPTLIATFVLGTGAASKNDTVFFDPIKHNQRSAMLLFDGVVYACWASFCDRDPYHGWIMGFDVSTYKLKYTYNTTRNGSEGGIWMAGNGPSVDENGNIYFIVGNGTVGVTGNPNNIYGRGESLLKFKTTADSLQLVNFFTPGDYVKLEANDLDYGNGTAMLIPNSNLSVSTSKEGKLFLLDDTKLGKCTANDDSALQGFYVVPHNISAGSQWADFGTPIYYHYVSGADSEFVYVWASFDSLKQFRFNRANMQFDLSKTIRGTTTVPQSNYGPVLSGSSDGTTVGTGIVWALRFLTNTNGNEVLEAYDARDVRKLLWSSNTGPAINKLGVWAKFNSAMIANGKVYVPSQSNKIYVFGLHTPTANDISSANLVTKFTLYPDPAKEYVDLTYSLAKTELNLTAVFYDLYGRQMLTFPLKGNIGENSQTLNFGSQLKSGIYSVIIRSGENLYSVTKLVKY
jgi:hypothetical protein